MIFDLLNYKMTDRLLLPWGTFTPICFFSTPAELGSVKVRRTDGRTDEQARPVLRLVGTAAQ